MDITDAEFVRWWESEGRSFAAQVTETTVEDLCRLAWLNGMYVATTPRVALSMIKGSAEDAPHL